MVMEAEFDRLQRYADRCKPSRTQIPYLDQIVSQNCNEREAVKKDLLQLGVHSFVHVAEVFSIPGTKLLKQHLLKRELVNEIRSQNQQRELVNEILSQSQQERRSDSRSELKNKHLRVLLLQIHGVPAAVRAVQAADSSSSQTAIAPSMHSSKRQKVVHGVIWSWKDWSWKQSGTVFNDILTLIF